MLSNVEVRHLRAVIVLAEELNFTRSANRMHITQPALSKQIAELEEEHRFQLFTRDKRRVVDVTDAGRIFVEEARSVLLHAVRAVQLARATHEGGERVLIIGYSPYADQSWVSAILAMHLPLYPKLRICPTGQFPIELVRSVLAGEINLGLIIQPASDSQITAVPFALAPVYIFLPENHPVAGKEHVVFEDVAEDEWIMFPKRFDPIVHDAIVDAARRKGIVCKRTHEGITPEQAIHLVVEHLVACRIEIVTTGTPSGVGILPSDGASAGGIGVDVTAKFARQIGYRGKDAASDDLAFDLGKPNLDLVEP